MNAAWKSVAAACLPSAALTALAPVRTRPGVRVAVGPAESWAFFPAGDEAVLRCLRPVAGIAFFASHGSAWHALGRRLPCDVRPPVADAKPLDRVLFPQPLVPHDPPSTLGVKVALRLVPGGPVRPASALQCPLDALTAWADGATTAELAALRGGRCGGRALLLGNRLPALPGQRYWGSRVLVPLGQRPDPDLGDDALRTACDVADNELLLLDASGPQALPLAAFTPLTRAGVRLTR